ncbi:hypothetical protein B0H14DRAFT_2449888, partial [Mycena olivaceomarginata]
MPQELDLWAPLTVLAAVFLAYRYYSAIVDAPPPSPHSVDEPRTHESSNRAYGTMGPVTPQTHIFGESLYEPFPTDEAAQDPSFLEEPGSACDGCGHDISRATALKCPGCSDLYCSQSCLENLADWHVRYCTNPRRPLTTADNLVTATFEDMFPDDPQTNEDYFFNRVRTPHDKTYLFGLYIGILKYHDVKPSTLHEWRLSGTMVENIKALYEPIPVGARGGYYPWFLKHLDIFEPSPNTLITLSPRHICASCGVSARVRCSACLKVWYCSKKCQQDDWGGHIIDCRPRRPITSADHLRAAVHRKRLPQDLEILSDYGFTRVGELDGKILLDVYQVLFEEGVHPRDVHQWNIAGNLLEEVEKVLRRLEGWKTFRILRWFEEHRYVFDPTIAVGDLKHEEEHATRIRAAQVELWNAVGDFPSQDHDEISLTVNTRWPRERANFFFFRSMLGLCHPSPELDLWVDFGFCACYDESEEQFLSFTYGMLVDRCTYDEFLTAYSDSKIIQLLDAKGLRGRRIIHPYLEDVLSGSPVMFKSVWFLKKHVQYTKSVRSDLIPSVRVDYGFMNCTSDREYQDLKDLYKNIFERRYTNPLELHQACLSGSLYDYVLGLF